MGPEISKMTFLAPGLKIRSMANPKSYSCSTYAFNYLLILVLAFLLPHQLSALADDCSLVVGKRESVKLDRLELVENSPGVKLGSSVVCERVKICGLSRLRDVRKYSHVVKVRVSAMNTTARGAKIEYCFHRNVSLGLGMCHWEKWKKLGTKSLFGYVSPFDRIILDIRMPTSSVGTIEVTIAEEFVPYRMIFLVTGLLLLTSASSMSKSILFYYSSAMTVGVLLIVLMVLFQGMKLLPTGRKSSIAIFVYSVMVGFGSFLLSYLSNIPRTVLAEIGISEDMYGPLAIFITVLLVLAGAWLGFWVVRKLVLTADGTIDVSTSHFVAWAVRLLAAVMILQSSLDPLMAGGALFIGATFLSIMRRVIKLKYFLNLCVSLIGVSKSNRRRVQEVLKSEEVYEEYVQSLQTPQILKKSSYNGYGTKEFTRSPFSSPAIGSKLSESDTFYSSFHSTPERKNYSKEEWKELTRRSTKKALEELVSSPDFSKWAVTNAERISLIPNTEAASYQKPRRWFPWP